MTTPKVFFWVQHLLGIGHLKRTAVLTRAFQRAGMKVTIVSGGQEVPGLNIGDAKLIQLPPVRAADKYFKVLIDEQDREIDQTFINQRRDILLQIFKREGPDIILTELFPFGRRQLRAELTALLDEAINRHVRPLIISSVRDILVDPPKPERVQEMLVRIEKYYDRVLVHGDPNLIPFGETFRHADQITDRVAYSGYVVDVPQKKINGPGTGEVIVSAGGGAVSEELFRAAMAARIQTSLSDRTWRILAGNSLPQKVFAQLKRDAPEGFVIERARPDFTTMVANCILSISQGGYNTVMEVLAARTRGVIVPYAGGLETEQTLRTRLLQNRNGIRNLPEKALNSRTLANAVEDALSAPAPDATGLKTDGADTSARLIKKWFEHHTRGAS